MQIYKKDMAVKYVGIKWLGLNLNYMIYWLFDLALGSFFNHTVYAPLKNDPE